MFSVNSLVQLVGSQTVVKYFFLSNGFFPEESIHLEHQIPRSLLSFKIVLTTVKSELRAQMCCCSGVGSSCGFQIYVLGFVGPGVKHLFQISGGDLQASDGPALTPCTCCFPLLSCS